MKQNVIWMALAMALWSVSGSADEPARTGPTPQPVLVELFTSEGCSSCPPADAVLERLDRTQPVAGAQIIVLSEHVDYWNHIGWADPYSSPAFSARQQQYAERLHTGSGPYTPQMIVDGQAEFVGSDAQRAESAIRAASRQPKTAIRLVAPAPGAATATLEVDPLPAGSAHTANVYFAYAAEEGESNVLRGENSGRRLHHVAILKDLRQMGTVTGKSGFRAQVPLKAGYRLVAFVQEPGNGPVWGAAMRAAAR